MFCLSSPSSFPRGANAIHSIHPSLNSPDQRIPSSTTALAHTVCDDVISSSTSIGQTEKRETEHSIQRQVTSGRPSALESIPFGNWLLRIKNDCHWWTGKWTEKLVSISAIRSIGGGGSTKFAKRVNSTFAVVVDSRGLFYSTTPSLCLCGGVTTFEWIHQCTYCVGGGGVYLWMTTMNAECD